MEGVKIYGLCLERLKHQINNAGKKMQNTKSREERFLLECYNTAEIDDIIDILELYDIEDRTREEVREKLEELAYTVSELLREPVLFDYTEEGHLGLYLALREEAPLALSEEVEVGV